MNTRFYEDNGGGIHAVVRDETGDVINWLTGFQHDRLDVGELFRAAMDGFGEAGQYDPESYAGLPLEAMVAETESAGTLIAAISEVEINLYPSEMGIAGKILFGLNEN